MYEELEQYLSNDRLKKYLLLADNDKEKAIELYETNLKYSSNMYLILSCFEVILRNAINNQMQHYSNNWILDISIINHKIINNVKTINTFKKETIISYKRFFEIQNNMIYNTQKILEEEHKEITNNYLISRLNFGFWTRLFNKTYETELWNKYLYKIFTSKVRRGFIEFTLNDLRRLRNRIAHNENILNLKHTPSEYYDIIINTTGLINTNTKKWMVNLVSRDLFE